MSVSMMSEGIRDLDIDPVARVSGALSFHAGLGGGGGISESHALATMYRGYENLLVGRDARDATFIASRACGVCGGSHSIAAAQACEMAFGTPPPPAAIAVRGLMAALEHLIDYPHQLFIRQGPDYSETTVRDATPDLWSRAEASPARGEGVHGFKTIAQIMTALNARTGALYQEALLMSRLAREAYVLVGGKYPHPETMVPAGVSTTVDTADLNIMFLRVLKFPDYAQRTVAVWDDIVDFFLAADQRYAETGVVAQNFVDLGLWDDPNAYDASYEAAPAWGERRWATPGVIVNGTLVTTSLTDIDRAVEEFVEHSFYEQQGGRNPASKQTVPRPSEARFSAQYSWCTAPRWQGNAMETGPGARMWTTAMANRMPHRRFIEPFGAGMRFNVPRSSLPPEILEWRIPPTWGTFERTRARAYALVYSTLAAYEHVLVALDLKRVGETFAISMESHMSNRFKIPGGKRSGLGFWGSGRGYLSHTFTMDGGVIKNYQIVGPSTWTMSPQDGYGLPGPCEQAVNATQFTSGGREGGLLDILRTIRSYDPCMACATH
jgi:hydrogenase large subunit